jgi:hypothetical protein
VRAHGPKVKAQGKTGLTLCCASPATQHLRYAHEPDQFEAMMAWTRPQ